MIDDMREGGEDGPPYLGTSSGFDNVNDKALINLLSADPNVAKFLKNLDLNDLSQYIFESHL
jgi:hypothetical protein